MEKELQKCIECKSSFSNTSNLRKHIRKFHAEKSNLLAPRRYKISSNSLFTCDNCGKIFNHKHNFQQHKKTHDTSIIVNKSTKGTRKCPLCNFHCSLIKDMYIISF